MEGKGNIILTLFSGINFLLFVVIFLLLLTPLKALAGDCWVGSLEVKVHEKIDRQLQTKVETYRSSYNANAEGHVMFSTGEGQLNIISKNISGNSSFTLVRDTGCVIHEGDSNGILTEGIMTNGGKHAAYWKINSNSRSTIRNIKGCMQDPIPPIKETREEEDFRFEGIVHPNIGKLISLCSSVKRTPALGYCHETSQGFFGVMIQSMGPLPDKASRGEGREVYGWFAMKVPCGRPSSPVNRCLDNYGNCKQDADIKLKACYHLCELKSLQDEAVLLACKSMVCDMKYEREMGMCNSEVSACVERATRE